MKRKHLTAREIEIAMRFKDGWTMAGIEVDMGVSNEWIQIVIRKAMKMKRWWVPAPRRPPAKGRNKEER